MHCASWPLAKNKVLKVDTLEVVRLTLRSVEKYSVGKYEGDETSGFDKRYADIVNYIRLQNQNKGNHS